MTELSGGCLCGAVRYRAMSPPLMAGHCYCTDCRRTGGTSHSTHVVVPQESFALSGQVRCFEKPADSGHLITRCFCPECGTSLYSRNAAMPGMVFLLASGLDEPDRVEPAMTVYAARAPGWALLDRSHPVFDLAVPGGEAAAVEAVARSAE